MFDKNSKKRFATIYKSSNYDINQGILLLEKGVYPYEYMDDWQKSNKALLSEKNIFIAT